MDFCYGRGNNWPLGRAYEITMPVFPEEVFHFNFMLGWSNASLLSVRVALEILINQ